MYKVIYFNIAEGIFAGLNAKWNFMKEPKMLFISFIKIDYYKGIPAANFCFHHYQNVSWALPCILVPLSIKFGNNLIVSLAKDWVNIYKKKQE